jgi:hypothetical protein
MVTELAVDEWIKPASGPKVATIETPDIAAEGVYEWWEPGTHLFLQVDVDPAALPNWQFRDRTVKKIASSAGVAHDRVPVRAGVKRPAMARRPTQGRGRTPRHRGIRTSGSQPGP